MMCRVRIYHSTTADLCGLAMAQVDFAAPKGYVEPTPQPRAPPPTMASKLKIDANQTESIPPTRASTPGSNSGAAAGPSAAGGAFRGGGQTLSGKKTKGKKERKIEDVDPFSMVRRTK